MDPHSLYPFRFSSGGDATLDSKIRGSSMAGTAQCPCSWRCECWITVVSGAARRRGEIVDLYTPPMIDRAPRIVVVEDDDSLRHALEVTLREEGYEVAALANGDVVDATFDAFRPDLAILDIRLPGPMSGLEIARAWRGRSDLPILFVTAADSVEDRVAGFDAGGDDYLTKPFAMPELLARVHALLRRAGRLSSSVRQLGDIVMDEGARTVHRNGKAIELTRREFDLLATLARRPGQVFSKDRLLVLVWGYEHYDRNVVEVHVSALRRKLEVHGPRAVHTVRGIGYVLRV